ncbi:hypothetical protein Tco_1267640 [Tanacetum coccineum]
MDMPSPRTLKHMQSLSGKLESLNRFLSKSAKRSLPFLDTLKKCTNKKDFRWIEATEAAFLEMKKLIFARGRNKLYSDGETHLGSSLCSQAIKEVVELGAYDIQYVPRVALKGQVLADFLADTSMEINVAPVVASTPRVEDIPESLNERENLNPGPRAFQITHIPRVENRKAGALSKLATVQFDHFSKEVQVEVLNECSVETQEVNMVVEEEGPTWMTLIQNYLEKGILPEDPVEARTLMEKLGIIR